MQPKCCITMPYSYLKKNTTLPFKLLNKGFEELYCATVYYRWKFLIILIKSLFLSLMKKEARNSSKFYQKC